jgi:uncharacterized membrane protein YfcA
MPMQVAIGASLISVGATSTGASVTFVRRMDQFARRDDLECVIVTGALIGAYLAGVVPQEVLEFLFALMML